MCIKIQVRVRHIHIYIYISLFSYIYLIIYLTFHFILLINYKISPILYEKPFFFKAIMKRLSTYRDVNEIINDQAHIF